MALTCVNCGKEILPGTNVKLIGPDDFEGMRIFTDDQVIVAHEECPKESSE